MADQDAQQRAIGVRVAAENQKDAAENHAYAIKIKAEGTNRFNIRVDAKGIQMRNAALNTLAGDQITIQVKMKLLEVCPASSKPQSNPLKKIDGIKIIKWTALNEKQ